MHKIINCIDWQAEESWVMKEIQRVRERKSEWKKESDTKWWNESERLLKLSHKNTLMHFQLHLFLPSIPISWKGKLTFLTNGREKREKRQKREAEKHSKNK